MKRKEITALCLVGVLLSGIAAAVASEAGSADDPLIALSWLKTHFLPQVVSEAEKAVDARLEELAKELAAAGATGVELRVKRDDMFELESGSSLTCLAGEVSILSQSAVVDITSGQEVSTGLAQLRHRYLADENSMAAFTVSSDTAVIRLTGPCKATLSDAVDYNMLADGLKELGLFRGSDVPYGSGYELEAAPTRIQGLIMFLRLLGEEPQALAYPGSGIVFSDVPEWAVAYVAYAYDKGYTKGQSVNGAGEVLFGPSGILTANDYMTFLLRALGYEEEKDFHWVSACADARTAGVLTAGEAKLLAEEPFLRAQVAYLSYYTLSAKVAGEGITLLDRLVSGGIVKREEAQALFARISQQRLA